FGNCGFRLMVKRFLVYVQVLEEAYACNNDERRVVDVENDRLNTNHAVVGYFTARSWRLPEHLCEAIANHHNLLAIFSEESSRNARLRTLLSILKMAEHICGCHRVLGNQVDDHEWAVLEPTVLEYVGLSEYDFENFMDSLKDLGIGLR
ncbi:MAG: HDOD domain-containing protein, partial [Pseudomonas sp.]